MSNKDVILAPMMVGTRLDTALGTMLGTTQATTLGDPNFEIKARQRGALLYKSWQGINVRGQEASINPTGDFIISELNRNVVYSSVVQVVPKKNAFERIWNYLVFKEQIKPVQIDVSLLNADANIEFLYLNTKLNTTSFRSSFFDDIGQLERTYSSLNSALNINPTSVTEKINDGVIDFCEKEGIKREFYQYLSFIKIHFSNIKNINVYIYPDPEIDNTFKVVFEVFINAEIEKILKMQDQFYNVVIDWLPIKSLDHFVLKCEK